MAMQALMNHHQQPYRVASATHGLPKEPQDAAAGADKMNLLQDIDTKQKTLLTNIQNNFNNISQLNTINLQPLVASFINKSMPGPHQPTTTTDAFDPRCASPEQAAAGIKGDRSKDTKWDQNQPQARKQQAGQAQAEAMKVDPANKAPASNKQQLMQLLLKNYKQ